MKPHPLNFVRLVFTFILLFIGAAILSGQNISQAADLTCDHTIDSSVSIADGQSNYAAVQPGDTVCLLAGTRDILTISNFHGTENNPITIINSGGTVTIVGPPDQVKEQASIDTFKIESSSHLRITGTGVSTQCGARYSSSIQDCGIVVSQGFKGLGTFYSTNIEIDHVEVHHTGGPGIKLNPGSNGEWTHYKAYVHDNYAHDNTTEGLYIGANYRGVEQPSPFFRGLDVSYNRVEDTAWGGIDIKSAIEDVKVHHNVIRNTSLTQTDGGLGIIDSPTGDYYNNWIEDINGGFAVKIRSHGNYRIFNNVIIDANGNGINWRGGHDDFTGNEAQVFNNTIINSGNYGIWVDDKSSGGKIFSNIIVDSHNLPIESVIPERVEVFNNLVGSSAEIKFVSPTQKNYNLSIDSLAIDASLAQNSLDFDFNDLPRDSIPDIGAFEYVADTLPTEPTSEPSPPPTSTPEPLPASINLVFDGPNTLAAGSTTQMTVEARNVTGDGLYGAQFEINYDPALISISNLQINPDLAFVVRNQLDETAGTITFAASRQGELPGLTGDVTLVTFDVTAAGPAGTTTLTFENELISDPQAFGLEVEASNHTISIDDISNPVPTDEPTSVPTDEPTPIPTDEPTPVPTDEPTPVPTDEPTPVPTDEPTPVPTDEPTPAPTGQPTNSTISAQIILPGRANNNWSDAMLEIEDTGQNGLTDATGQVTLTDVEFGTYTAIIADAPGYLSAACTSPAVTASDMVLTPVSLLSGDVDGDDVVDVTDAAAVGTHFDETGPDLEADINRDNSINIFDIVLISYNYGKTGPQVWDCLDQ